MARLARWKSTEGWKAGKYIPGMATFLTEGRYHRDPVENGDGRVAGPEYKSIDDYEAARDR